MRYKEEVLTKLDRVLDLLEGESRAVEALEKRCDRLEEQNEKLFEKLMSRNWETWVQTMQMQQKSTPDVDYQPLRPDQDEENAGMALALEIKEDDTSE